MPHYHRASTAAPIFFRWRLLERLHALPGVTIRRKHHYGLWTVYEFYVNREWYWHAKPKMVELPYYTSLNDPHTNPDVAQNHYELSRYLQDKGHSDEELIRFGFYPRTRKAYADAQEKNQTTQ